MEAAKDSSLQLKLVPLNGIQVLCDVSGPSPRPFVPLLFRRRLFEAIHGLVHPSMRATRRLMAARAIWISMNRDINAWCCDCQQCNRARVHRLLFLFLAKGSPMSTWTWLGRFQQQPPVSATCWQWWIPPPSGWRRYRCAQLRQQLAQTSSSPPGWQGLAFPPN